MKPPNTSSTPTLRVWDLPLRVFHWGLVITVIGSFTTIKLGGLWMDWHVRFGLAAFSLIVFRIIWGLVGPKYARFTQFIVGPDTVIRYLRGRHQHVAGHNPLGALSVIALLVAFGFQAFSGLFADDDIFTSGPLAYLNSSWSSTSTGLHKLNEWIMIELVALHIFTIIWYRIAYKTNLASTMIHGDIALTDVNKSAVPAADNWTIRIAAAILVAAISSATWWMTSLAPTAAGMSFM